MDKRLVFGIVALFCVCLFGSAFLLAGPDKTTVRRLSETISSLAPARPALDGEMLPHKALYEIEMVSSSSGSQIVNISGHMYFEWTPTCEAWTTDHRFNLTYEYTDSPAMQITSDFTTWEARDGSSFNFSSRRSRSGEIYEEIRGSAVRFDDGRGEAIYTLPEEISFDLQKDFMFPMEHTRYILSHIEGGADRQGTRFINRTLFDGSDTDGPVEVNAFMGQPVNAMARTPANPKLDVNLLNGYARNVHMAFFPHNQSENAASDYEMTAVFHKNSVISDMFIDYNEFSVQQSLIALEELDVDLTCDEGTP